MKFGIALIASWNIISARPCAASLGTLIAPDSAPICPPIVAIVSPLPPQKSSELKIPAIPYPISGIDAIPSTIVCF